MAAARFFKPFLGVEGGVILKGNGRVTSATRAMLNGVCVGSDQLYAQQQQDDISVN
jgi:hypothetical protein